MSQDNPSSTEEEQLRRYIMLVSYSGMGIDKQLDNRLRNLRNVIKNKGDNDQLKDSVDGITEHLRTLEESIELKEQEAKSPIDAFHLLLEQLQQQNLPKAQKKSIKKLLKQQQPTIEQMVDGVKQIISEMLEGGKGKRRSWNPFAKKDDVQAATADDLTDPADTVTSEQTAPIEQLPSGVIDALNNFVEQLAEIEIYKKATSAIKEQLVELSSVNQLTPLIEQIASALLEAANQEHIQFENFLQTLNKRLLNVASYLNQAAVGNDGILSDTEQLDKELKSTIADIKQEIESTPGLGDLKGRLLSSFEHIFSSVTRFKDAQNTRVEATKAELSIIKDQLLATEDEAVKLKENLNEQRFRAYNDPLTQLPNRYAYNERLKQEYTRWQRYRNPLTLAVGDIDLFKSVNDNYGHAAGDKVLQHVARILEKGVRESDFVARYGGEEFIILMPETGLNDATKAINKLRLAIAKNPINVTAVEQLHINMSFGVSEFEGSETPGDVFIKADKALYRAKAKGRNQVCCERS
ncbi:MAG: GGDEF domain-containing protein [Kangiellaceae bacterium]|jgi:diguanylate cyclase|nr:GGDEF domain-containing protein [Kangiellaceae bacterium]